MLLLSLLRRRPYHGRGAALLRAASTSRRHALPPDVDLSSPTFAVWGSNTGVGKTLVSAALALSVLSRRRPSRFLYLKPVQTGFPEDSDSRFVLRKVSQLLAGPFTARDRVEMATVEGIEGMMELGAVEETSVVQGDEGVAELDCRTLFCWREAVSPHLAAERERATVEDTEVVEAVGRWLGEDGAGGWRLVETAGGVASPGPSGTLQCDLYRTFRLPCVLVGDGRLGGISGTISSYECLKLRGYDVVAVILEDHGLSNELPLLSYLRNRVHVLVMPHIPRDPSNNLIEWFHDSHEVFSSLHDTMLAAHSERTRMFHDMAGHAADVLWWPFTQHNLVSKNSVTVIDSRYGENFAVHKVCNDHNYIVPQFDACASWWTQGPDTALQIELARDIGYATARFGHVMYPENVYEPAFCCAKLLLGGVGQGWASRVFFSDNGSTAIEIALKMAFRKFSVDSGILNSNSSWNFENSAFKVLALRGSYHGDTLGAMEAQSPSAYTSFLQQPWYSGRGLFLEPPTIYMCKRIWNLSIPKTVDINNRIHEATDFGSLNEVFCWKRDASDLAQCYDDYISKQLFQFSESDKTECIAALIIEPVIHGAGGMHMIDPLFQRVLVNNCQRRGIPVIFDEVLTGFWRLGTESASQLLGSLPDIACYAKLMTGGIVPLAATLATESVFDAFKGDTKTMALLHGHSYSAHAIGCSAAASAIKWFRDPQTNPNICVGGKLKELWNMEILGQISCHHAVQRVVALGTLCAIELKAEGSDAGYASLYASSLVRRLREDGIYMRPLGNVIYLMCGPCTPPETCSELLAKVHRGIDDFGRR